MPPQVADDAVRRFADALIWNWLIAGTDAHAKNYSLLLADNQVRLAPLYDIASALPYATHEKKLWMAMNVGGDYRVFFYQNTWPDAARDLGLDAEALVLRVRELLCSLRGCLPMLPWIQQFERWIGRCQADWWTWSRLERPGACS